MTKPHAVVLQLSAAGYIADFLSYSENGETLLGTVKLDVIEKLKQDARFACGVFYGLHRDVGHDLIDFRSFTGTLGKGSLQLVIDKKTGACYADIDGHNPYQDLVGTLGHLFGAVIPGFFKRKRRQETA